MNTSSQKACIVSVSKNDMHRFSKINQEGIYLIKGIGVEGDAHAGEKVKHRSRVKQNPNQPNLRQVHLIHKELLEELAAKGFPILPGQMGENITTEGIDLLKLPTGTRLHIGQHAIIEITGLRNPCKQLDDFIPGLMRAVLDTDEDGNLIRKAGIMAIVIENGYVYPKDSIHIHLPNEPYKSLEKV